MRKAILALILLCGLLGCLALLCDCTAAKVQADPRIPRSLQRPNVSMRCVPTSIQTVCRHQGIKACSNLSKAPDGPYENAITAKLLANRGVVYNYFPVGTYPARAVSQYTATRNRAVVVTVDTGYPIAHVVMVSHMSKNKVCYYDSEAVGPSICVKPSEFPWLGNALFIHGSLSDDGSSALSWK